MGDFALPILIVAIAAGLPEAAVLGVGHRVAAQSRKAASPRRGAAFRCGHQHFGASARRPARHASRFCSGRWEYGQRGRQQRLHPIDFHGNKARVAQAAQLQAGCQASVAYCRGLHPLEQGYLGGCCQLGQRWQARLAEAARCQYGIGLQHCPQEALQIHLLTGIGSQTGRQQAGLLPNWCWGAGAAARKASARPGRASRRPSPAGASSRLDLSPRRVAGSRDRAEKYSWSWWW